MYITIDPFKRIYRLYGCEYCNLLFLIDAVPINCKIKINSLLILKVFRFNNIILCKIHLYLNLKALTIKLRVENSFAFSIKNSII
ncbi:hypothetical protein BLA32_05035 (plasmid) [Borreliella afzelii]|nr:hypothetical protein BAFK78_H003 [Borreliella afzelii K78]APJ09244.1 hypothetical protein BLA32_05035 [Borreliella afzelii]